MIYFFTLVAILTVYFVGDAVISTVKLVWCKDCCALMKPLTKDEVTEYVNNAIPINSKVVVDALTMICPHCNLVRAKIKLTVTAYVDEL